MKLIHRAVLKSFLATLAKALAAALVLFTLIDILEKLGSFIDNGASTMMILRYCFYTSPFIIDIALPIAMLMATLFSIGTMARYFELTALFAAGWSIMVIARPIIIAAVCTSLLSFAWREFVMPPANAAVERIWEVEVHGRTDRVRPTRDIGLTGEDGRLYHATRYEPDTQEITGLRIVTTEGARVLERIDAEKAQWTGEHWVLLDGVRRVFDEETEDIFVFADLIPEGLSLTPEVLRRDRVSPEDMTVRQLQRHIHLIGQSGSDTTMPTVDLQFRIAFPIVHIIVVFMGVLLASGPRKTTVASGFFQTVLISFGYYVTMNFGRALGHSGALPPIVAAWSGNAIYTVICGVLFARARR